MKYCIFQKNILYIVLLVYEMYWCVVLQLDMILPERAYAFFSHTHKAQKENMPLLDKVTTLFIQFLFFFFLF